MKANIRAAIVGIVLLGAGVTGWCHVAVDDDFARGVASAEADFAQGRDGWYFHFYSNMPNGPDDPVLVRKDAIFIALLREKHVEAHSSNSGCILNPALYRHAEGYNSVADKRLREKFGANYMDVLNVEVARRMKMPPDPAALPIPAM
jgi:hypothetical protein